MKNEIIQICSDNKLPADKQKEIANTLSSLIEESKRWEELAKVEVSGGDDKKGMKLAKENRLSIKNKRLEAEKFIKSKRVEVQEAMAVFTAEDKTWLRISQLFDSKAKEYESSLEDLEKLGERLEAERVAKLVSERRSLLAKVCDNPDMYPLGTITEESFIDILEGFKALKEKQEREAAEAQLRYQAEERARLEREQQEQEERARLANLQRTRLSLVQPYGNHGPTVDFSKLHELEEKYFQSVLEKKKNAFDLFTKEQENLRKIKQEADARAAREKAEKETKEKRQRELAKAPVKSKMLAFVNSFQYTDIEVKDPKAQEIYNDILSKFSGFQSWAKKQIETL